MAPAKTRKRKSDQAQPVDVQVEAPEVTKDSKRQKKLPVRARDEDKAQPKGTLMVFDDDDTTEAVVKAPLSKKQNDVPVPVEEDASEEDDSDDEAPEAVSTQKAASDVKKSAQAAQQAAKEQAVAQKRKRQQRDAMLKQQAEERKKTAAAESESESESEDEAAQDDDDSQAEGESLEEGAEPEGRVARRRSERLLVPNLLPEEFLTDSSSEDEEDDTPGVKTRPKRRKVATAEKNLARLDKPIKDVVAGSTVYRVAKKVDESMAPKARKHAKSSRNLLLKRNRTAAKPRSGFFASK